MEYHGIARSWKAMDKTLLNILRLLSRLEDPRDDKRNHHIPFVAVVAVLVAVVVAADVFCA